MFCDFQCLSLLIVLARSEDNIEAQVKDRWTRPPFESPPPRLK